MHHDYNGLHNGGLSADDGDVYGIGELDQPAGHRSAQFGLQVVRFDHHLFLPDRHFGHGHLFGRNGVSAFNATQQARAELALTLWDDVIASSIQKVTAGTTSTAANIEFGNATSGVGYAHAYFPSVAASG